MKRYMIEEIEYTIDNAIPRCYSPEELHEFYVDDSIRTHSDAGVVETTRFDTEAEAREKMNTLNSCVKLTQNCSDKTAINIEIHGYELYEEIIDEDGDVIDEDLLSLKFPEVVIRHWFIIDETKNGDIFEDDLGDISHDAAAMKLLDAWDRLTPHDREQHRVFYAARARVDADSCVDYGSIDDTIELNVEPRSVSLDNGAHYDSDVDYLMQEIEEKHLWDALVNVMDGDTRELVHEAVAPCSNKEFLRCYLLLAPGDLVIG